MYIVQLHSRLDAICVLLHSRLVKACVLLSSRLNVACELLHSKAAHQVDVKGVGVQILGVRHVPEPAALRQNRPEGNLKKDIQLNHAHNSDSLSLSLSYTISSSVNYHLLYHKGYFVVATKIF